MVVPGFRTISSWGGEMDRLNMFFCLVLKFLVFGDGGEGNGVLIVAGGLDRGNIGFVGDAGLTALHSRVL